MLYICMFVFVYIFFYIFCILFFKTTPLCMFTEKEERDRTNGDRKPGDGHPTTRRGQRGGGDGL